jgi:type VI protein secretion system component VasK
MANDEDPLKLRVRETNISILIKGFSETPSGQELQTLLQRPLGNLRTLLGAGEKDRLARAWTEQIMPAAKEVEKGFPFDDGPGESDLTKLTAFLNPTDGKLSKFYKDSLEKYFEESNGQLKVKDQSDLKFTDEFVAYLNNAFNLRKALFGTSATPKFEYELSFKPVKDALIEVTIDGQKVTSEGTGAMKGTFPAAAATETGVIMKFASTSAASSTSSAPPSNSNTSKFQPASGEAAQTYAGTWGLFKFVEAGKPQKQAGGEYLLSYSLGGKAVSATIKPSGGDLFDKTIFKQFKAPQTFLK